MRQSLLVIAVVHVLMYVAVGFDVPVLRQIISFIYLTFVPGFVLLRFIKSREINTLEIVLFSVGLSIAFLMFVGLLINELYPIIGVSQPLSTISILLTMSGLTLSIFILGCKRAIKNTIDSISFDKIGNIPISQAVPLMFLPVLSVVTAIYAKGAAPLLIVVIAVLFLASVLSTKLVPAKLYPLLIFAVSLSLTLQLTLMSTHVMGSDSPLEYFVYKLTAISGHWAPTNFGIGPQSAYNSMLSITILPNIYSALMHMDGELVFKVLYPFLFSLVPVILYRILAKENWRLGALLSSLFFISSPLIFYGLEQLSLNRQIVAELFLLLSILLLLGKQFSTRNNRLIYVIFGAALAVSHYSLMIIYLVFLVLVFVIERIRSKPDSGLNAGVILLLFGISFSWYSLTPSGVVNQISSLSSYFISHFLSDLSNPAARSSDIFTAHSVQSFASTINWTLFIVVHFLVVTGIFAVALNRQEVNLDLKYRVMIILSSILLFLVTAVPNLAPTLNFSRFYAITFLFLAPCFVFGCRILFLLSKKALTWMIGRNSVRMKHVNGSMLLIGVVLSAYFLSQSGFINHISGASPQSYTLDWDRIRTSTDLKLKREFYIEFTPEQDVVSATWLSKFMTNGSLIYSDFTSRGHPLKIYGLISDDRLLILTDETEMESNSYIYLRYFNVVDGLFTPYPNLIFNTTALTPILNESNCIYANGGSDVYAYLHA